MLKLPDLIKLEIAKLVHAHFNNKLPNVFSNYFTLSSNISQKTTRSTYAQAKRLYTLRYKIHRLQRCIKYEGAETWNGTISPIKFKNLQPSNLTLKCPDVSPNTITYVGSLATQWLKNHCCRLQFVLFFQYAYEISKEVACSLSLTLHDHVSS